jgi:hypothetical protein
MAEEKLTLEERDIYVREQELKLKEREVVARETEVSKSRWTNPLVLSLLAAAAGLIGNVIVAINTQNVEHLRAQSTLILEAIKTGDDKIAACKNLTFFVRLGLLDDANKTIFNACPGDQGNSIPTLPASRDSQPSNYLRIMVMDDHAAPIPDATVHTRDNAGNGDNCKTREDGLCILPPLPIGDALHISAEKQGYKSAERDYTWTGSGIIVMVLSK